MQFTFVILQEFGELVSSCNADCVENGVCRTHLFANNLPREQVDGYYVLYFDQNDGEERARFVISHLEQISRSELAADRDLSVAPLIYCFHANDRDFVDHFAINFFQYVMNKYLNMVCIFFCC